jgi:hypothetical protein
MSIWRRGAGSRRSISSRSSLVRSITLAQIRDVLGRAEREGYKYCGSQAWLARNEDSIASAFIVILDREPAEKAGTLPCFLVLLNHRNYCGHMRLTISTEDYSNLPDCTTKEMHLIALNLAVRGTLLKNEDDSMAP